MPTQTRRVFMKQYGLTTEQMVELRYLLKKYKEMQEHAINGDPHPLRRVDGPKSAHIDAWKQGAHNVLRTLEIAAAEYGFDGVDCAGVLYPRLMKGEDKDIVLP